MEYWLTTEYWVSFAWFTASFWIILPALTVLAIVLGSINFFELDLNYFNSILSDVVLLERLIRARKPETLKAIATTRPVVSKRLLRLSELEEFTKVNYLTKRELYKFGEGLRLYYRELVALIDEDYGHLNTFAGQFREALNSPGASSFFRASEKVRDEVARSLENLELAIPPEANLVKLYQNPALGRE